MMCIDVVTVRRKNCESILNKERNNESENMKTSLRLIRALLLINYNIFVLKHGQCSN
jgi:hypothetical protein